MNGWLKAVALTAGLLVFASCAASGDSQVGVRTDGGTDASAGSGGGDAGPDTGQPDAPFEASSGCPSTCQALGADCGQVTDPKCGGTVDCGDCPTGQVCGAGGPNLCGVGESGACQPKTCAELGADCGPVSDTCGGTVDCGTCEAGLGCGVGGQPNVCATLVPDGGTCQPKTCGDLNLSCGPAGDGCGNVIQCGTCPTGESCGAGGSGKCGASEGGTCTPKSCADQQVTCGPAGNGCGGILNCGSCALPQYCGGGGPGKCGCTGVCALIPTCPAGQTTTLTGKVYDPGGFDPLYNVLVYIPNDPSDPDLKSFPVGPTCDVCGATAAGNPLVTTHTAADGSFTLSNVPAGNGIPLVIQLGRWRRVFSLNVSNSCGANTANGTGISGGILTMPKNKSQGNIPLTAIVTGNSDALECVFLKMGIDQAEFTNPSGTGRIHLYQGDVGGSISLPPGSGTPNDYGYTNCVKQGPTTTCTYHGGGARINTSTPSETALFQGTTLDTYDMSILSCQGAAPFNNAAGNITDPALASYAKLDSYADGGGRVFASHFSYTYMTQGGNANEFNGTANWTPNTAQFASQTGYVDTASNPKGNAFAQWLSIVGALTANNPARLTIYEPREDTSSVIAPTQQWLYWNSGANKIPLHFTFNTPVGAAASSQCGRGLFSDFHVVLTTGGTGTTGTYNQIFPAECGTGALTPQEKVLEFMIFDLGACVTPYQPLCTPTTCSAQGISCGPAGDGCGGLLDCGTCPAGTSCGGGGTPGKCGGTTTCTALTCGQQNLSCGPAGDGCGNLIQCGSCPTGETCGGGGTPGKCGAPEGGTCTKLTCAQQNIQCGPAGDGCGGLLACGTCPSGQTCGGGGTPGQCGAPSCTPLTCASQGVECGPAGDGCGGALDCGNCPTGEVCGLAGPGKCGTVK